MDRIELKVNGETLYRIVAPPSYAKRLYDEWGAMKRAENEAKTLELIRKLTPWLLDPFEEGPDGDGTDPIDPVEIVRSEHVRTGERLVTVDGRTMTLDPPAGFDA